MTRRAGLMEKYRQQMKSYKKMKMKVDNTPYFNEGEELFCANVKDPDTKYKAEVVATEKRGRRTIITSVSCPYCGSDMHWSKNWEAFACKNHEKTQFFELVRE